MDNQKELLTHEILDLLTQSIAQIGQALSVHLPAADIDEVIEHLTVVNSKLNALARL